MEKERFDIVKCSNCGFIFVKQVPDKKVLRRFYEVFDYQAVNLAETVIRKDAKRSLRRIQKYVCGKKRLLDIGCGRGFFLDEARRLGYETYGLDTSEKMVGYSKSKLRLNVTQADIISYSTKVRFDVVALNQFIEHFSNPRELITKCHELLESDGIIYIATPNIDSLTAIIQKEDFDYLIPPEHLGFYNKETLSGLLKSSKFNVIYIGSWSYPEDLAGIIKKLIKKTIANEDYQINRSASQGQYSVKKTIKHILFDKLFCQLFYRILDTNTFGTNLEMIGQKV